MSSKELSVEVLIEAIKALEYLAGCLVGVNDDEAEKALRISHEIASFLEDKNELKR